MQFYSLSAFRYGLNAALHRLLQGFARFETWFFAAAVCYLELVFKCATVRTGFGGNLLLILLFSISFAGFLSFLTSFFRERVNRIIRTVLLFLLMIPFGVEFFVFQEYNFFYDINTIRNGAGGAATGFLDEIARLVFSFSGIGYLLLLALPAVLYIILGKRFGSDYKAEPLQRTAAAILTAVCLLAGIGLTHMSKRVSASYKKEYSFPAAVSNFGLLTGIRLDLSRTGNTQTYEFEAAEPVFAVVTTTCPAVTEATVSAASGETTCTETTVTTFGRHECGIDFAALAEQESGTYSTLSAYIASLEPASENEYTGMFKGKNLIFITAEAFTKEAIDKDRTPTLYRLYTKGIRFKDYYQPTGAGTTGGEFQNVFGLLPMTGGASFPMFAGNGNTALTMSAQLNKQHYWGKAYHNNDYTFYSRHITHNKLGFSEGFMGYGNGMEQYVKYEWPESDLDMIEGTIPEFIGQKHFQVYYMTVSGHSGYGRYGNAMSAKNWDKVADMDCSEPVKAYYACNIELDKALGALVQALEKKGIADDTVICLSPDHFPYGLDDNASFGRMFYLSELYGYDVRNSLQRDHNAAILWCGCLEDQDPIVIDAPVSSLDLLPTLSNLFGLEYDSRLLPGRDVFSDEEAIYFDREYNWKTEQGYYLSATQTFYPNDENADIPDGYVERIKTIVRNKVTYCQGVIYSNYFAHLFPQT
ncbi:MAG: LTA synthase family protein [Oscillospiraceae bacterium]|nr:LTA synthase family protein [Oscillospiraceae bacterium]